MKAVYLATTNKGKVISIRRSLAGYKIAVKHMPIEMPELQSNSMKDIAENKVRYAYGIVKKPCIVLDSGFFVNSLNGFPGAFVHFALDTIGINGLLKLTEEKSKRCEFKDCLAYYDGREPLFFESSVMGELTRKPMGKKQEYHWSDLFLVFIPKGEKKTLAQMSHDEYKQWYDSRYGKTYIRKFAEWFLKYG